MPPITIGEWLRRLFLWDGALPLVVWSLPRAVAWLLPGQRGPIEVLGVVLPMTGFLFRFFAGLEVLRARRQHALLKAVKVVVLFFGLFFLMMIDAVMILRTIMPANAFGKPGDFLGIAVLYCLYVMAMGFATFPGWPTTPPDDGGP